MKYLERIERFLNESTDITRIYFSPRLREILRDISMKTDNPRLNVLVGKLLSLENNDDYQDKYTLIDITDKNDKVSFVQVNRILRKYPDTDIVRQSYVHSDKSQAKGAEFWKEGRTDMAVGKWFRRMISDIAKLTIEPTIVELFTNLYKSTYDKSDSEFEIVTGEDIRKWYLADNYESLKGQLGSSCMRYERCQPYLDIYTKNPEVCSLLILKGEGNTIKGRALIWTLTNGSKYMDRVYTVYDSDSKLFSEYAADKLGTVLFSYKMIVELGDFEYDYYPYMDTFKIYNISNNTLYADSDLNGEDYIKLESTYGGSEGLDVVWSDVYGEYISQDDAVWVDNVSTYVVRDDVTYLSYIDEYYYDSGDGYIVYCDINDQYYLNEDTVYSEIMETNINPDYINVVEVTINSNGDTDYYIKDMTDLYIEIDGKYYDKRNYIKNPFNEDKYTFIEDVESEIVKYFDNKTRNEVLIDFEKKLKSYKLKDDELNRVIDAIESNEYFNKNIKNVYWGLEPEDKPTPNDMIPVLFASITNQPTPRYQSYVLRTKVVEFFEEPNKINKWLSRGMMEKLGRFAYTFDYSVFPDEIYRMYLRTQF